MREPIANSTAAEDARVEEAIEEARKLLKLLAAPVRSWSIVNWNDPERDPRDEFYAAVGFIHGLLDPDPEKSGDDRRAADNFLGEYARIVREVVLPALRRGLPPKRPRQKRGQDTAPNQQKKDRLPGSSLLLRDRRIAAVVEHIHRKYGFNPTRNSTTEGASACFIVAEALKRLGIKRLGESHVATIWRQTRQ
jgi:hypothetical protein